MPQLKDLIIKTEKVNWQELKDLQPNNLKTPHHSNLTKESLIKNGFAFSFYIWEDKDASRYLVDGHLRTDLLRELKNDGFDIPDQLSCTFLDLPNRKTAVKYLLEVFNTKKNPIDREALNSYLLVEDIQIEEIQVDSLSIEDLEEKEPEKLSAEEDDFEIPDHIKTDIVKGDVFEVRKNGKVLHKIGCGSSTDLDFVNNVKGDLEIDGVLTDPPYGVDITKSSKDSPINDGRYIEIANDQTTEVAKEFYQTCLALNLKNLVIWGGNYFTDFLPPSRCWIIWDKETPKGMTFARGEIAWTDFDKNMEIYLKRWMGNLAGKVDTQKEVIELEIINKSSRANRSHPTQKSIELHGWIINDFFKNSKVLFDGFGGSGTTLLACHQTNKQCVIIEVIPEYCQVIINRIKKLDTDIEIVKI